MVRNISVEPVFVLQPFIITLLFVVYYSLYGTELDYNL